MHGNPLIYLRTVRFVMLLLLLLLPCPAPRLHCSDLSVLPSTRLRTQTCTAWWHPMGHLRSGLQPCRWMTFPVCLKYPRHCCKKCIDQPSDLQTVCIHSAACDSQTYPIQHQLRCTAHVTSCTNLVTLSCDKPLRLPLLRSCAD